MSGTTRSSEGLDPRRRKILFRCWHRGMREVDLLLGQFADARIDELSDDELDQLEQFMEAHDVDIFSWFAGSKPVDPEYDAADLRDHQGVSYPQRRRSTCDARHCFAPLAKTASVRTKRQDKPWHDRTAPRPRRT